MKLKKVGAVDTFLDNVVARTDDMKHTLYKKDGQVGERRKEYVLVKVQHLKAETKDQAIEKAQLMIDYET